MRNLQLIAQGIDTVPILNAVMRQPELWERSTYSKDFTDYPFKDCDSIYIRFTPNVREFEPGKQDPHESVWMDGAIHIPFRPVVFGMMAKVEGERLGRVFINRLKPGGTIFGHTDPEVFTSYWSRFHLVLQSAPGCNFKVGEEQVYMRAGELWWFDHSKMHEVVNNSVTDRIHLIMDIKTYRMPVVGPLP